MKKRVEYRFGKLKKVPGIGTVAINSIKQFKDFLETFSSLFNELVSFLRSINKYNTFEFTNNSNIVNFT